MQSDRLISEFNEAKFQILRLHILWTQAKRYREQGDPILLRWTLDSAEIELYNDVNRLDGDIEDLPEGKKAKKFNPRLKEVNDEVQKAAEDKDFSNLYLLLIKKEKLLREIQDESGKGAKLKYFDDDGI